MSVTKNEIKQIQCLQNKKGRNKYGQFIVEGEKVVDDLLVSPLEVIQVYATKEWANPSNASYVEVSERELKQISLQSTPHHVLAVVKIPINDIKSHGETVLCLDQINDPGNLGTMIRTCDWMGIKTILCSKGTVDCYNPKVVQSAKGSLFSVEVAYVDLAAELASLKTDGYQLLGTAMDGGDVFTHQLKDKTAVVMGSEANGVSPEISGLMDVRVSIPKKSNSSIDSLNVATAAAIILGQLTK